MAADPTEAAAAGGELATAILIVGEGAALFAAFCPSWFTVRSPFFHEQDARAGNIRSIRQGETAATVLTVGMGWAATLLTRSALPLAGSIVVSAAMIAGYEYSIRHPAREDAQEAQDAARPIGRWTMDPAPLRSL